MAVHEITPGRPAWIIGSGLGYNRVGEVIAAEYVFSYIPCYGTEHHAFHGIAFSEEYQAQEFVSCLYRQSKKWFIDWNLPEYHLACHPSWRAIHQYIERLEKRIKANGRLHEAL